MKTDIVLQNFEILRPTFVLTQEETLDFLVVAHQKASEEGHKIEVLLKRFGVKPSQISSRGMESYEMSASVNSIGARTRFFGERASGVLQKFYQQTKSPPAHLVHVTCTGYISPSPAQVLVQAKDWSNATKVTHAYHMGCYASIPAVRMAEGFVQSGDQVTDIVHTEMCSLHLNPKDNSPEQFVVQTLFADGYVKYSAVPAASAKDGFRVRSILEKIIPNSEMDMTWMPAEWGMQMTLSRDVPEKIGKELRTFMSRLCEQAELDLGDTLKNAIFAIHPGGPKIIDAAQTILELSDAQVAESKAVLFQYGNMSSVTLPHVWKAVLENSKSGQKVISLAFGPGLTIFGAVFEVV